MKTNVNNIESVVSDTRYNRFSSLRTVTDYSKIRSCKNLNVDLAAITAVSKDREKLPHAVLGSGVYT